MLVNSLFQLPYRMWGKTLSTVTVLTKWSFVWEELEHKDTTCVWVTPNKRFLIFINRKSIAPSPIQKCWENIYSSSVCRCSKILSFLGCSFGLVYSCSWPWGPGGRWKRRKEKRKRERSKDKERRERKEMNEWDQKSNIHVEQKYKKGKSKSQNNSLFIMSVWDIYF